MMRSKFIGFALGAVILASCETAPPPAPVETPVAVAPEPEPTPEFSPYEPRPRAAPAVNVAGEGLPDATVGLSSSPTALPAVRSGPERGPVQGITRAHNEILRGQGKHALAWSEDLARSAELIARQSEDVFCRHSGGRTFSAKGEAAYVADGGRGEGMQPKLAFVSPKTVVDAWKSRVSGPWSKMNSAASELGCARHVCPSQRQVWLCRYE